ncbi:MAG: helix-turn-helix domain-containing protein [Planctomycetota bacterium]
MNGQTNNTAAIKEPLLLSPREAARALRISERTLFSLTKNGDVPCVRIGRLVRYAPSALQDWIERNSQKTI